MRNDLSLFNPTFDLFDPFFDDDFFREPIRHEHNGEILKTDVIENEKNYELITDIPGLKKEDVKLDYENGYLTITAQKNSKEEDKNKKYVRKERHYFKATRSFYVGDIKETDITAKVENGELHITVPKEEQKVITKKSIEIQ